MEKRSHLRDATRSRLLSAAAELMIEERSSNISLMAIAQRADVATRTVYNHFASLDDLLAESMDVVTEQLAQIAPEPVSLDGGTPESGLENFLTRWFHELERSGATVEALLSIRGSAEIDDAIARGRDLRRRRVHEILKAIDSSTKLRAPLDDAVALAFTLSSYQAWVALVRQTNLTSVHAARLVTSAVLDFAYASGHGKPARRARGSPSSGS